MPLLGEQLQRLCEGAKTDVFLVAPFIKQGALFRIVNSIPETVRLIVVVRFLPEDLASGVTDFEIVDYLWKRPRTTILFQPALHAKLYRVDDLAMIGSANLTGRALGWSQAPNIELLLEVPGDHPVVQDVERRLRSTAIVLTPEIASSIQAAMPAPPPPDTLGDLQSVQTIWIPSCLRPEFLWQIYEQGTVSNVTQGVISAAKRDLDILAILKGLSKPAFDKMLHALFQASRFYELLSGALSGDGLPDSDAQMWLEDHFGSSLVESAHDTWLATKRWLREFGPIDVRIEADTERTRIATEIGGSPSH